MLRLQDEDQINNDVQPAGDDAQQAPQADEGTADEGAVKEKTEGKDIEGGTEETSI